jgi:hypothetical protein
LLCVKCRWARLVSKFLPKARLEAGAVKSDGVIAVVSAACH